MDSDLYLYSNSVFDNSKSFRCILSNIAYTLAFEKQCKDIYLYGNKNNINVFISLLKLTLENKIITYKDYLNTNYKSTNKITNFMIIEEDDKMDKNLNFSKILVNKINNLHYITNYEIMIKFNNAKYNVDIESLSNEFKIVLTNYINFGLQHKFIPFFDDNLVVLEDLYNGYFINHITGNQTPVEGCYDIDYYYKEICNWCNKNLSRNNVKEYLIEMFNKPNIYNGWKLD